jgi:hypothetical protein
LARVRHAVGTRPARGRHTRSARGRHTRSAREARGGSDQRATHSFASCVRVVAGLSGTTSMRSRRSSANCGMYLHTVPLGTPLRKPAQSIALTRAGLGRPRRAFRAVDSMYTQRRPEAAMRTADTGDESDSARTPPPWRAGSSRSNAVGRRLQADAHRAYIRDEERGKQAAQ